MKLKTSVTLSEDVLAGIGQLGRAGESRSETIERLLRERILSTARQEAQRRELERINARADQLNAEAADALTYQVVP